MAKPTRPEPHNPRGEWRPVYELLFDDPEFQALSSPAQHLWLVLKVKCGSAGIRLITALEAQVMKWSGYPSERVREGFDELERAGRIRRQGDIVWVVNGINYEPTMYPSNDLHRKHVERTLNALPRCELVRAFAVANPQWLNSPPEAFGKGSEGVPEAFGITSLSLSPTLSTTRTTLPHAPRAASEPPGAAPPPARNGNGHGKRRAPAEVVAGGWPVQVAGVLLALGPIAPGHVGKKLKALHDKHGPALLVRAAEAFVKKGLEAPADKAHLWEPAAFLRRAGWWVDYVRPGGARRLTGEDVPDGDEAPSSAPAGHAGDPADEGDATFLR